MAAIPLRHAGVGDIPHGVAEVVADGAGAMTDLAAFEWRVGGHGDCPIFAVVGYDRDVDAAVGLMNTAELAAAVVEEHNAAIREAGDEGACREALRRIDALPKRWDAPVVHAPGDDVAAAAWAAVGSEAHLIAHRALGGSVESARALLVPVVEDVEPTLAPPSIAGEESRS